MLPITKKILHQPQFDGYHQHPVDVHSIKCLKKVGDIQDEHVKKVYDNLEEKEKAIVRLVALFHDVGKGRTIDHHIAGEQLFKSMATSFGLEESHIQRASLLIRYHNMMSMVANNEDIYNEKTILKFTALVKDEANLKMLYVVTYADISAVGKSIYKSTTAQLLRTLYNQCIPAFENTDLLNENARRLAKQEAIKKLKRYKDLPNLTKEKSYVYLQIKCS